MKQVSSSIVALATALVLAGCAAKPVSPTPTSSISFAELLQDAISACTTACKVAPTLETITNIALALVGGNATATFSEGVAAQIATAFCNGVSGSKSLVRGRVAMPHLRLAPLPLGGNVFDYGTITVNGHTLPLRGSPTS